MKKNLIVTMSDKSYIDRAKQLFSSIYWNSGWKGDYMLLAQNIPEKDLKWFRKKGILIKKCSPFWKKEFGIDKINPIMLNKFYLFTPEFKKWKNIVYLDADIIVKSDIQRLAEVKGFAAIKNIGDTKMGQELKYKQNPDITIFNAGVFAFNTQIIKNNNLKALKQIFYEYKDIIYKGEQTLLNIYFQNNVEFLPSAYNLYIPNSSYIYSPLLKGVRGVLHFCGNFKPWDKRSIFYEEWKNNLDKAESIDLSINQKPSEIKKPGFRYDFYLYLDLVLFKFGKILNRISPQVYKKIKKIIQT